MGDTDADEPHPLVGRWVPDFGVATPAGSRRIAELARDGRPLLVDLTESGAVAAALTSVSDQLTVSAGSAVGPVAATALLVRPDGYVAWASSQLRPDLVGLRGALKRWFGIQLSDAVTNLAGSESPGISPRSHA
jgi:hypothetical protein